MNKIAFIYPGQGAQKVGMGEDFYKGNLIAKEIYDSASSWLDMDVPALCFTENENLDKTSYTQAAMVTTCLAMTAVLTEQGVNPDVTAGLSLGEYCAIACAGGMTTEDAIKAVRVRGILMEEAVPTGEGAMAAVLGLDGSVVNKGIQEIQGVSIANYNCPGQIVITGKTESVLAASDVLKEAGAKRIVMLNVSGPFHSEMLEEAGTKLGQVLEGISCSELKIPYVTNVTGEYVTCVEETKALLVKQVSSSVQWEQSIRKMIENGVDTFVEIGPGKTLAGFMKKIDKSVAMYNIQTLSDIDNVVEALKINGK